MSYRRKREYPFSEREDLSREGTYRQKFNSLERESGYRRHEDEVMSENKSSRYDSRDEYGHEGNYREQANSENRQDGYESEHHYLDAQEQGMSRESNNIFSRLGPTKPRGYGDNEMGFSQQEFFERGSSSCNFREQGVSGGHFTQYDREPSFNRSQGWSDDKMRGGFNYSHRQEHAVPDNRARNWDDRNHYEKQNDNEIRFRAAVTPIVGTRIGFTKEEGDIIRSKLIEDVVKVAKLALNDKTQPQLRFAKSGVNRAGLYLINAVDEISFNWLLNWDPPKIAGYKMHVVHVSDLEDSIRIGIPVLGTVENFNSEKFLKLLYLQNRHLNVKRWKFLTKRQSGPRVFVVFLIDKESFEELEKIGWFVWFELVTLIVRFLSNSKINPRITEFE